MIKTILSIIFIGASIGLFVLYDRPTYDNIHANTAKVANFDAALRKTKEIQQLKADIINRRNVFTQANVDKLKKMLPDHVDNVRLILDLDGIAAKYGLRLSNVGIQKDVQKSVSNSTSGTVLTPSSENAKPYRSLTLKFTVKATYEEFLALLQDLESSLRIVDITNLTIKPNSINDNTTVSDTYTFGIAVRTYWLP